MENVNAIALLTNLSLLCGLMQKSKFLLVLFLISSGFAASAQQLVSGFVRDTGSNEAIIGAVVKCLETDQNTGFK